MFCIDIFQINYFICLAVGTDDDDTCSISEGSVLQNISHSVERKEHVRSATNIFSAHRKWKFALQ